MRLDYGYPQRAMYDMMDVISLIPGLKAPGTAKEQWKYGKTQKDCSGRQH